jgi:hypothetical protein
MAVTRLSPLASANDFNLNIGGTHSSTTFNREYSSGAYSITSSVLDTSIDIYAYNSDGSLAGYTSTKAFIATKGFSKMVVIGGTSGDVLGFTYKNTFTTSNTTAEVTAGPFITDITPSAMANQDNSITITGGNFASDVAVAFTGTSYSSTAAKSIVRTNASELIVTRPDNFPVSASPYTVTITNPGVNSPVGTNAHIAAAAVTAGVIPSWSTSTTLPAFQKTVSYSQSVVATDADGSSSLTYSENSSTLPTGITFSAGTFSGTPSANGGSYTASIRATDSGGNFVDRTFTMTQDKPDAPTIGVATALSQTSMSVEFTAPSYTGTSTITSYTATSSPGGVTATLSQAGSGTITVTGLTSDTAYTFTVTATNTSGASVASSASTSASTLPAFEGNYYALGTVTVPSGGLSSITFSGIPQTGYTSLQLRCLVKTTSNSNSDGGLSYIFNDDSGSNYSGHSIRGSGSSATGSGGANTSSCGLGFATGTNSNNTSTFASYIIDIVDYAAVNKFKTTRSIEAYDLNGVEGSVFIVGNNWRSYDKINKITFQGVTFAQNSQFALYGVK